MTRRSRSARHALAQACRDGVFDGHCLVLHHHQQRIEFLDLFAQSVDLEQRRFESKASAQCEFYDRRLSGGFGHRLVPVSAIVSAIVSEGLWG